MASCDGWRGLYAIIDPGHCAGRPPERVADAVLEGGCAALQLRAKQLGDGACLSLARALAARCRERRVPFVVNDRADLARLADADGLHLGQDDVSVADARRVVPNVPIGLSTHDEAQAREAPAGAGADLIGFGPVFATRSKANPDPVVGIERLRGLCADSPVPVVAIGGMDAERAAEAHAAGAQLVAAITAVTAASDPAAAARALHAAAGGRP